MIQVRYLTPKQFRHENPKDFMGSIIDATQEVDDNGNNILTFPYHVSTKIRLHEYGHVHHNHVWNEMITPNEWFLRECDAEYYAYLKMGKLLSLKLCVPAISCIIDYHFVSVSKLFNWCLDYMKLHDIPIIKKDRSGLWNYIMQLRKGEW